MQREKPAFEVIPNRLALFPAKLHAVRRVAVAENQMRAPSKIAIVQRTIRRPRRHESPPNVMGAFIDRSSALWNFGSEAAVLRYRLNFR
jgi:hypothetical protein